MTGLMSLRWFVRRGYEMQILVIVFKTDDFACCCYSSYIIFKQRPKIDAVLLQLQRKQGSRFKTGTDHRRYSCNPDDKCCVFGQAIKV